MSLVFAKLLEREVPLVDDEEDGLELLGEVLREFLVRVADGLGAVDEHDDDIGAANGALGAVEAVELDVVGGHAAFFSHAGGIDDDEGFAFLLEAHVDAVARGAGDFGNDDALRIALVELGDGVDQGALAGVSLADDRQHHLRSGQLGGSVGKIDVLADGGQKLVEIADVERGDADGRAKPQAGEVAEGRVGLGAVGLVGNEQGLDPPAAEQGGDLLIPAGQTGLAVHQQQDQIRLRHRQFDLVLDVFGQLVGVNEPISSGVHEFDKSAIDVKRIRHAVARDAGQVLDDADASAGEGVEQAALSDVGPADDGDDGHGGHGFWVPRNGDFIGNSGGFAFRRGGFAFRHGGFAFRAHRTGDLFDIDRSAVISGGFVHSPNDGDGLSGFGAGGFGVLAAIPRLINGLYVLGMEVEGDIGRRLAAAAGFVAVGPIAFEQLLVRGKRVFELEAFEPIFADGRAELTADFDAHLPAGPHRGGADKRSEDAVFELQGAGEGIFDLDFGMDSAGGEGADGFDGTDDPLNEIDLVNALVHDRPTAVELPGPAPAAVGVILVGSIPGRDRAGPADFSKSTLLDGIVQNGVGVVPTVLENAGEPDAEFFRRRDHLVNAIGQDFHGLFDQDVQPPLHGRDGGGLVIAAGRADVSGIQLFLAEHFLQIGIERDRDLGPLEGLAALVGDQIADRDDLTVGQLPHGPQVHGADDSRSDDRDTPLPRHCWVS